MIADNEPGIVGFLALEFEAAGYNSIVTHSPEETRKEFIRLWNLDTPPKIVLLDVALGSETGWDVVKFIRKYDRDCLVFMFTGHKNPIVDKLQIRQTGANGIIYKPKDGSEVLAQIKLYEKNRERSNSHGQAGRWTFTDREMLLFVFNIIFAILVIGYVADSHGILKSLTDDVSLTKGRVTANEKAIARIQGKSDAEQERK